MTHRLAREKIRYNVIITDKILHIPDDSYTSEKREESRRNINKFKVVTPEPHPLSVEEAHDGVPIFWCFEFCCVTCFVMMRRRLFTAEYPDPFVREWIPTDVSSAFMLLTAIVKRRWRPVEKKEPSWIQCRWLRCFRWGHVVLGKFRHSSRGVLQTSQAPVCVWNFASRSVIWALYRWPESCNLQDYSTLLWISWMSRQVMIWNVNRKVSSLRVHSLAQLVNEDSISASLFTFWLVCVDVRCVLSLCLKRCEGANQNRVKRLSYLGNMSQVRAHMFPTFFRTTVRLIVPSWIWRWCLQRPKDWTATVKWSSVRWMR